MYHVHIIESGLCWDAAMFQTDAVAIQRGSEDQLPHHRWKGKFLCQGELKVGTLALVFISFHIYFWNFVQRSSHLLSHLISLQSLFIIYELCCWCFAVPTFCTIYPCRSLPKVVLEYFWRHSSYLQVTNNTNTIQKRHENNTNNDEHGCNTNVLIPLMFHQFVPWGRDVRLVSREPARRHRSRSRWVDYLHQADRSDIGTNTST